MSFNIIALQYWLHSLMIGVFEAMWMKYFGYPYSKSCLHNVFLLNISMLLSTEN
jgi:hypothetical protein